jgi:serine/threonine-protein kinase HipA
VNARASACLICLRAEPPDCPRGLYHPACLERLFGVPALPRIDFDRAAVIAWSGEHAGKMSISGYQPKAPLSLTADRSALILVERGGGYILKPQHGTYASTPENEHLTMCLGRLFGLHVAEAGLLRLADASYAYVTRRFDRLDDSSAGRRHMLDFCQLTDRDPEDKDFSSAEECAAVARQYAGERGARELFELFLFSYWVRNGDLHLKNIALIEGPEGGYELAPAYDLLCTWLYGNTGMMLGVRGERKNIPRKTWLDFATRDCGVPRGDAEAIVERTRDRLPAALAMIERSPLPNPQTKQKYARLLEKRSRSLLVGR